MKIALRMAVFAAVLVAFTTREGKAESDRLFHMNLSARPLSEVASRIATETDLDVEVDPEVREWKATVVYDGPPRALLSALAENFGLLLEHKEKPGEKTRYSLRLPEKERLRLRKRTEEAERAEREFVAKRSEELVRDLEDQLRHADAIEDDPTERFRMGGMMPGAKPFLRFLGTLDREDLLRLCRTPSRSLQIAGGESPVNTPGLSIPFYQLSGAQQGLIRGYFETRRKLGLRATMGMFPEDAEKALSLLDLSTIQICNHDSTLLVIRIRYPGTDWGRSVPVFTTGETAFPSRSAAGDAISPLKENRSERSAPSHELRRVAVSIPLSSYPESVLALGKSAYLNIVADAFTLSQRFAITATDRPLSEVLKELGQAFELDHKWDVGILLLRSQKWEERLEQEPPASILDQMIAAVKAQGSLSLSERALAATALTVKQLGGLAAWSEGQYRLATEALNIAGQRPLYTWCATLSTEQRQYLGDAGLPVSRLSTAQRENLMLLLQRWTGLTEIPADAILQAVRTPFGEPQVSDRILVRHPLGFNIAEIQ